MTKNIVLCSDGTGQDGLRSTNVVRVFAALDLGSPERQIGCYDPGVGTVPHPDLSSAVRRLDPGVVRTTDTGRASFVGRPFQLWAGLAVGYGLFQNVRQLYEVLLDHYDDGDQLYFFGFSRGAFTIRVLAGLLYRCGLLLPEHRHRYAEAFKLYVPHLERLGPSHKAALLARVEGFKSAYCRPIPEITFLGLWDTVKSVGYLWPKSLPHTRHNPIVKAVRHALSLDERRSFFVPTSWGGLDSDVDTRPLTPGQDVQEVWFPGNHSDVGGGYPEDPADLTTISLHWIVNAARSSGRGLSVASSHEILVPETLPPGSSHDELAKWPWRAAELLPRWEIDNHPRPPKREFKWGPSGRRSLCKYARNGEVLVDVRARDYYPAARAPWSDLGPNVRVRFIDTAARNQGS